MGFFAEFEASEAARPPDPPKGAKAKRLAALDARIKALGTPTVTRCPCGEVADLFAHCLACDTRDGYALEARCSAS